MSAGSIIVAGSSGANQTSDTVAGAPMYKCSTGYTTSFIERCSTHALCDCMSGVCRKCCQLTPAGDCLFHTPIGFWVPQSRAKAGGQPVRLATDVQSNMDFALSDSAVYFFQETRSTFAGQITVYALRRVAKTGGTAETVDVGEIPSGKLSVRGDRVVFTDINSVYLVSP